MKTVLVVDDEPAIRDVVEAILSDHGFDVVLAWSGRRMLEFLESNRPSLILLDMMMPDGDGREVLQTMQDRPHLRGIPVVMMSAALGPGGIDAQISGFLRKPFNLDDLLEVVVGVIGPPAA